MKRSIIAAILFVLSGTLSICLAQQADTVTFSYDLSGNRTLRQIVIGGKGENEANNRKTAEPVVDSISSYKLSLYPNPTEGKFSISIDGLETAKEFRVLIVTASGAVVCDKYLSGVTEEFDLTQHPAGIYLLRIIAGEEICTWKIVKK